MFSGIVEEMGTLLAITRSGNSARLKIGAKKVLEGVQLGDSIAVNGICLTVTDYSEESFSADVMHETMNRSSIGRQSRGGHVNLERALRADGRFGGHIVTGHVDGTGEIAAIQRDENAIRYKVAAEQKLLNGVVEKGSIAIDGISLTVTEVTKSHFSVSVIPHTIKHTILSQKKVGDIVNLETDYIGKYVAKFMGLEPVGTKQSNISTKFLAENGFI